jgi:hypothetical protein
MLSQIHIPGKFQACVILSCARTTRSDAARPLEVKLPNIVPKGQLVPNRTENSHFRLEDRSSPHGSPCRCVWSGSDLLEFVTMLEMFLCDRVRLESAHQFQRADLEMLTIGSIGDWQQKDRPRWTVYHLFLFNAICRRQVYLASLNSCSK